MQRDLTNQKVEAILLSSNKVADEILQLKGKSFTLSYQREKNREALRALKHSTDETSLLVNGFFIKLDAKNAIKFLTKAQEQINKDYGMTENSLKEKFNLLQDIEKQSDKRYFDLKPLSKQELRRTCVHFEDVLALER